MRIPFREILYDPIDKVKNFFYYLPAILIFVFVYGVLLFGSDIWSWFRQSKEVPWTLEQIEHDYQQYDDCEKEAVVELEAALQKINPSQMTRREEIINRYNQILEETTTQCCGKHSRGCMEYARIHARDNLPIDSKPSSQ